MIFLCASSHRGIIGAHTDPVKPGNLAVFAKSQGRPGIVSEFSSMLIPVGENKIIRSVYLIH